MTAPLTLWCLVRNNNRLGEEYLSFTRLFANRADAVAAAAREVDREFPVVRVARVRLEEDPGPLPGGPKEKR